MAGVRGFPGRRRRKNLSLFFHFTRTHTYARVFVTQHLQTPNIFRHQTPSDTKHLRLLGGAAGAMDTYIYCATFLFFFLMTACLPGADLVQVIPSPTLLRRSRIKRAPRQQET